MHAHSQMHTHALMHAHTYAHTHTLVLSNLCRFLKVIQRAPGHPGVPFVAKP